VSLHASGCTLAIGIKHLIIIIIIRAVWLLLIVDYQVSRSQILKSATSYIQQMTDKNQQVQMEIVKLKKMNRQLEQQGL